jgi:AsmA protein
MPRWLLIALGVVLVLLIAGYAALKLILTPEKLRAMVVPRVEEAVGRDVEIGSVGLRVFPRLAVRLDQFRLANPPEFGSEPAMSLEALELQVAFWPLVLHRDMELHEVRLIQPIIRYEVLADGRTNLEGLGPTDTTRAGGGGRSSAAGLVVSDLVVRDGTIFYTDQGAGRGARLGLGASLSLSRSDEARGALVSRGDVDMREIRALLPDMAEDSIALPDAHIEYELFAVPGDSARLRELHITLGELPLDGSGSVHGLGTDRKSLDFQLESGEADISELLASLPARLRREDLDASGQARLSLQVRGQVGGEPGPEVAGTLDVRDVSASLAEEGELLTNGAGAVAFTRDQLSVRDFKGQVLGREWQLQLTINDFATRAVDGSVKGGISLARLAQLRTDSPPMEGNADFDLRFSGSLQDKTGLRATGPVRLSGVSYQAESLTVPARVESATLRLTGAGVSSESLPVKLGDSDLTLSFDGPQLLTWMLRDSAEKASGPAPVVKFTAVSDRLNISEIMSEDTTAIGYGSLVAARLAGRQIKGQDPAVVAQDRYTVPPIPPINASGTVRVREFLNPPLQADNVSFSVTLENGQLEVRQLAADVYGGKVTGGASVDMARREPPFGLRYDVQLVGGQAGAFLEQWTRLGAALQGLIDFRVSGSGTIDQSLLPVTEAVDASGATTLKEGRFLDFPVSKAIVKRFNAGPELFAGFRTLGGGYRIEEGRFVLEDWQLAGSQVTATVAGSAGFGGALDLKLQLMMPPSLLQKAGLIQGGGGGPLGNLLGQLSKNDQPIPVAVDIVGSMSDPRLEIDTQALQQALEKRLEGAGRDLIKRLIPPPR